MAEKKKVSHRETSSTCVEIGGKKPEGARRGYIAGAFRLLREGEKKKTAAPDDLIF